jgi:hypothetical protein
MTKYTVSLDDALGPPVILHEGDAVAWSINVPDVSVGVSSATLTMYRQNSGADVSSTYFTGEMSVSGLSTIVTKTTQNLKAGDWIVNVSATVDGLTYVVYRFPLIVKRKNQV